MLNSRRKDLGLLALRLGAGAVLVAHGSQKLFGWFGGHGLEGTGEAMESMGFRPGRRSALASGLAEAGGGTLLALGLATPAAGAAAAGGWPTRSPCTCRMGFFSASGGFEFPAFLGFTAAAIGVAGPGRYSLDHLTGGVLDCRWTVAASFAASAAAAALVISRRNAAVRADMAAELPEEA